MTEETCPLCGGELRFLEKDTSSGREYREYRCIACNKLLTLGGDTALWQLLHDANQEAAAKTSSGVHKQEAGAKRKNWWRFWVLPVGVLATLAVCVPADVAYAQSDQWMELDVVLAQPPWQKARVVVDNKYVCDAPPNASDHNVVCVFAPNCLNPPRTPKLWAMCVPAQLKSRTHTITVEVGGGTFSREVQLNHLAAGENDAAHNSPEGYYYHCAVHGAFDRPYRPVSNCWKEEKTQPFLK